ncbi:hypothetical protein SeMB42_g03557 [Synchytrium endobioticum]|uniref:Uncharacterized protein n=1 Tax=Synchytrium endobioticum TaxID=286115 RepID=A0A507D6G8_9FUNG|nr:hypothetical protein SeMB42_g03557 [Synchytrium endobioticum]
MNIFQQHKSTMDKFSLCVVVALLVARGRSDSWGGYVALGPSISTIVHSSTTLIPGAPPPQQNGKLFLWPGISNGTGHLIQSCLESWPDNAWCGGTAGQWCARASIFGEFGQLDGNASAVNADTPVKMEYTLEENQNTWTQIVTDASTGQVLSTLAHDSGPWMRGWGTGTECNDDCSPHVSTQIYTDTTITLASSDPAFGDTIVTSGAAVYTGLRSNADSTVWIIDTIALSPH